MNAIRKRDLQGFFRSPLGYVYIGAFLAVMNLYFFATCVLSSSSDAVSYTHLTLPTICSV